MIDKIIDLLFKIEEKRLCYGKKIDVFLISLVKNIANILRKFFLTKFFVNHINWRKNGFIIVSIIIVSQVDESFFSCSILFFLLWFSYLLYQKKFLIKEVLLQKQYLSRFSSSLLFTLISYLITIFQHF